MEVFCLVSLTDRAPLDVVAYQAHSMRVVEGRTKTMECLLNPLMAGAMGYGQELRPERGRRRHKDAAVVEYQAVDDRPGRRCLALLDLLLGGDDLRQVFRLTAKLVEEEEGRGRNNAGDHGVLVPAQQGIRHGIVLAWIVLHSKIIPKKLAYPSMLRDGRQALIQEILEGVVIRAHDERSRPQIRTPVLHRLDQADEFAFVCREFRILGRDRLAVERNGAAV